MSIYNYLGLKDFLVFDNEGDFYYLQIIQRRKENPDLDRSEKVIKNYYIENLEYFERKQDEIIKLCDTFNARAYLRLNRRNYKDLTYRANILLADYMHSGQYRPIMSLWDKVCGRYHSEPDRLWIIDVDDIVTDEDKINMGKLCHIIQTLRPDDVASHIKRVFKSKSGYHIITSPFDVKQFWENFDEAGLELEIEFHQDNPTNLYIP